MKWVAAKDGHAPLGTLMAGFNNYWEPIFVARARHEGALIPGKLIHSHGCAYISWGGHEIKKYEYEVLVDAPPNWIATSGNKIPLNAYPGGKTENHEVLFIGRVVGYEGETIPGKVQPSHKCVMSWKNASHGNAPANSLVAGHDVDDEPIYIARAEYEGDLVPGKLVSSHGAAFVPWGGKEITRLNYEVLIDSTNNWVKASNGDVPANAVVGGRTIIGEPLYVGRVYYLNTITPGKIQRSEGVCYIPFNGDELHFPEYEVLLEN
ncbi:unnamed protein product [Danaus chrysippus]|uniref:(African queen) hypothetical protein n=1 Tax=Danaus chrysippus TaxID=151541 RepID=A0A8J2VVW3_9NEOP|nr:unnamed protein product [Danaus chrysippus]